ncbi:MAG TPA: Spy/CpxP family protein refolding chaperone [Gemmatimonadaceae bacterium]
MSWIRMAIGAVAFCAVASVASAQGGQGAPPPGEKGGPGWGRGRMSQLLFNGIELTDAEKVQIDKIREKYRAEMKALRPEGGRVGPGAPGAQGGAPGAGGPPPMSPEARAKMDEIRTKQNAEFRTVLTTAQQAIFDKNVAEMKARKEQRRPPDAKQ